GDPHRPVGFDVLVVVLRVAHEVHRALAHHEVGPAVGHPPGVGVQPVTGRVVGDLHAARKGGQSVGAGVAAQYVGPADGEGGADIVATERTAAQIQPVELRRDADPGAGGEVGLRAPVHRGIVQPGPGPLGGYGGVHGQCALGGGLVDDRGAEDQRDRHADAV